MQLRHSRQPWQSMQQLRHEVFPSCGSSPAGVSLGPPLSAAAGSTERSLMLCATGAGDSSGSVASSSVTVILQRCETRGVSTVQHSM